MSPIFPSNGNHDTNKVNAFRLRTCTTLRRISFFSITVNVLRIYASIRHCNLSNWQFKYNPTPAMVKEESTFFVRTICMCSLGRNFSRLPIIHSITCAMRGFAYLLIYFVCLRFGESAPAASRTAKAIVLVPARYLILLGPFQCKSFRHGL